MIIVFYIFVDCYYYEFSVITGKLCTDELGEPTIVSPVRSETLYDPQYSSIDSIKEDEECGPSLFSVSNTSFFVYYTIVNLYIYIPD